MTKDDFFKYQAQTSPHPLGLEVESARGSYIYDTNGRAYLDMIAGVSANTLGHHPVKVIQAIKKQLDQYMHVMVYGEFVQEPQAELSKLLVNQLPNNLDSVYLTNSGTEATEGAIKLAKRVTGRYEIIAAHNAYHGNTQGAMSVCGNETQNAAFRPLIPGIKFIDFNAEEELQKINGSTAAVILETIQGGAGFIVPNDQYLSKVRKRCEELGALLILDEIQSGMGRTGKLFGFQHYNLSPDILITGKGLGGGMPIGAFAASSEHMSTLKSNPKLGHITTFGGHPVIAAAALATLKELISSVLMDKIELKERLLRKLMQHDLILEIRGKGLMLALIMKNAEIANELVTRALDKGVLLFWLLYEKRAVRITPPLTMSLEEIEKGCSVLLEVLNEIASNKK